MKKIIISLIFLVFVLNINTFAKRYWASTTLTNWNLYLNNGVAYIISSQMASHCRYNRAQINMDGTEYNKALYAYAMSAQARNKNLRYVVDDTQTICIISALRQTD